MSNLKNRTVTSSVCVNSIKVGSGIILIIGSVYFDFVVVFCFASIKELKSQVSLSGSQILVPGLHAANCFEKNIAVKEEN